MKQDNTNSTPLWREFWRLVNQSNRLKNNRMAAIRKWDIAELERLDQLIEANRIKSDAIIDKMKSTAA